jgi:flagellar motor switch/type III secretory pathway protein FliN
LLFPQFILKKLVPVQPPETLPDIDLFNDSLVEVDIAVGKTFATLDEIKALEMDDIVLLDDSNIHIMYLNSLRGAAINVNPSSQLVISMENENENWGDDEMTEQHSRNKSIWDSLEVEVEASFEKIKMKLGSLREITEGLVIDVASVANNKVFLDVEGRRIAAGELVIVGDKYGVKVTELLNEEKQAESQTSQKPAAGQSATSTAQSNPMPAPTPVQQNLREEDEVEEDLEIEEDFDEEDFELEDEDEEEEEELEEEEE